MIVKKRTTGRTTARRDCIEETSTSEELTRRRWRMECPPHTALHNSTPKSEQHTVCNTRNLQSTISLRLWRMFLKLVLTVRDFVSLRAAVFAELFGAECPANSQSRTQAAQIPV